MDVAQQASTVVFTSYVYPDAKDDAENRAREKARKDSGVTALAFDRLPIRFWDRFHGPRFRHLFVGDMNALDTARDLTPEARLDHDDETRLRRGRREGTRDHDGRARCLRRRPRHNGAGERAHLHLDRGRRARRHLRHLR